MKRAILICLLLGRADLSEGAASTNQQFTVTGYCACQKCCGRGATGFAANGKRPISGITVAGPRRYQLGTKIRIAGIGERVISDRLATRYDNRIDIFFPTHAAAQRFGIKKLTVTILK